jgi:hypothetical protein
VTTLRILGLLLIAAALGLAGWEAVGYFSDGTWRLIPVGQVWAWIHRPSLLALQPGVERYISPALWDDVIFPIIRAPAWAALGALGAIMLALSLLTGWRRRRRPRRR